MKYFNKKTLTILFIDGLFSFFFLLGLAGSLVHKNVYDALPVQLLVAELAFVQVLLLLVIAENICIATHIDRLQPIVKRKLFFWLFSILVYMMYVYTLKNYFFTVEIPHTHYSH
ncbi:MAG: hypothetical protein EAZ74_03330 [Alphaproteobacteria bacterium]|nr:MAG: hypothetical protein EAY76_03310 [Alphaproteobacteria bacterium]TAF14713.1 MAG: hypothetical protein EAZ74_03330 [Alphaproteobacteria bacterium]TAF37874.1 MAG: hypothetical protein EAZ66_06800 [Alphaproteobacteria bacterium]TAF75184.1 MAG: hypothetical protein EAZ52_07195 [Alphaproteobacteria bacterium]